VLSTVHTIQALVAFSDSIGRGATWVTKHYQGVLIELASQSDGMALFDCSAAHHEAQAFVPSVLFRRLLGQLAIFIFPDRAYYHTVTETREPNAFLCNYFVEFSSAGVKTLADPW